MGFRLAFAVRHFFLFLFLSLLTPATEREHSQASRHCDSCKIKCLEISALLLAVASVFVLRFAGQRAHGN